MEGLSWGLAASTCSLWAWQEPWLPPQLTTSQAAKGEVALPGTPAPGEGHLCQTGGPGESELNTGLVFRKWGVGCIMVRILTVASAWLREKPGARSHFTSHNSR